MKINLNFPKATVLAFLGGAVFFALSIFQVSSIPSLRREIETAEKDFVVLRQKNERLSEILSEIKTIESNLTTVQTALPASEDVPALIMQLEQIAKQSGMAVQHLGFGEGKVVKKGTEEEAEETTGVKEISVTTVVTGSYPALQTFLRNLENTSRVVNVTNFRFSPGQQKDEGSAGLSITLGIEAFYLAEAADVPTETPLTLDTTSTEYIDLIRKVKALRVYKSEVAE